MVVTPFTGVWVEIKLLLVARFAVLGHTFHGCVG